MFNKNRCLENVYALAKQQGKKIGDIEDYANVSRGYLSRISKPEGASPAIETLVAISDCLNVTLDFLIGYQPDALSNSEKELYDFVDGLMLRTVSKDMEWHKDGIVNLCRESHTQFSSDHPLVEVEQDCDDTYGGRWIYLSQYCSRFDERVELDGDSYHASLGSGFSLYLMNVKLGVDKGCELYIIGRDQVKPLCSTFSLREVLVEEIYKLINEIDAVASHIGLDSDTREIISRFLNHK